MWHIFFFRVCFLSGFLFAAWKWGDWRNWRKYYSSILFVMVVNLTVNYLGYHHPLWVFNPDAVVTTQTVVELLNTYLMLPATTLVFLSNLPATGKVRQCSYIFMWVVLYGTIEWIDHNIIGGISYRNGWSHACSILFDWGMFFIIRVHYARPLLGWLLVFVAIALEVILFNYLSAEMK